MSTTDAIVAGDGEAIDLGQSPGRIVIASAADTELACLAHAASPHLPSLRLASLMKLQHPMSIDLWVESVVAHAELVVLRVLGGRGYWPYGLDEVHACCRQAGVRLVVLPGDDRPDPTLDGYSTVNEDVRRSCWRYLSEGGIANARSLLGYATYLLDGGDCPPPPQIMPRAGLWTADRGLFALDSAASGSASRLNDRPLVWLLFYRALVQAGDLAPLEALAQALDERGLEPIGIYLPSLKDDHGAAFLATTLETLPPALIINLTGFAVSDARRVDPLAASRVPVLQAVLASTGEPHWTSRTTGLSPRDIAMQIALPELDGRVFTRAISFKHHAERDSLTEVEITQHRPLACRVAWTADLAAAWVRLGRRPRRERRLALLLANYPSKDGRLANGVGLDTPQSAVVVIEALRDAGFEVGEKFADANTLVRTLQSGPTNALVDRDRREISIVLDLESYRQWFEALPVDARAAVIARWGAIEADPHLIDTGDAKGFALSLIERGRLLIGIQPARGYHIDPVATYHAPDLVPPHHYLAFYLALRVRFDVDAVIHLGKHGNLEWLPGKALALSTGCWPEIALGPLPHIYPFIVNDPGEGTQAKRRTAAVIIDHLTPPLTRADAHGELDALERLVDEYFTASTLDPRRVSALRAEIVQTGARLGIFADLGIDADADQDCALARLDDHLCEIKELQIRDGLHVLGCSPQGEQRRDLLLALLRAERGPRPGERSLLRALAEDLGLSGFDPLDLDELGRTHEGVRPALLADVLTAIPWRTRGDTLERLEALARALLDRQVILPKEFVRTAAVLDDAGSSLAGALDRCGPNEIALLIEALDGRFVPPGPSGAPTRGRPDVLPTGRNFFALDPRSLPTKAAWKLGWLSASRVIEHHLQQHGDWPRRIAMSAWGTANMRTGGDDIAQVLALMGCRPRWDETSGRVSGIEVIPISVLGRPRVDVTLRVSGFFRDAFGLQMALIDDAVTAVAALEESDGDNPLAASARIETADARAAGASEPEARRRATRRIFGSKPGSYGAGLQALLDEGGWQDDADLAGAFLAWGGWAYGRSEEGVAATAEFERRLASSELVIHNQDNREHDILDSDDYYQFEGGLAATVRHLSGAQPAILHNDHSNPESPRIRTLKDEIGRIVRGRATNPKWIRGVMRHGYKGAFEIAATVDYLFAFAATSRIVENHHFDALFEAYLGDEAVRRFIKENNPAALCEIAARFLEAERRGLWQPRRNSALSLLAELS